MLAVTFSSSFAPSLLPASLLALLSFWSGTFVSGAGGWAAAAGYAAVLAAAVWGGGGRDPLRSGRGGELLLLALLLAVGVSWWVSPVARAGRVGLLLLPAFLLLPGFVARAWSTPAGRRWGPAALSLGVMGVALTAIVSWLWLETPGTSLPLGHHNLLASWLVALLPLALLGWREGGLLRLAAAASGIFGLAALLLTRSLAGTIALAVMAAVLAGRSRWRRWMLAAAGVGAAVALPRIVSVLSGADTSVRARLAYFEAGWQGFLARPAVGWGPGATAWTLHRFLEPAPGVLPASEVVTDLHSLPLQLASELGIPGALLVAGLIIVFVRARLASTVQDPALRDAGLLGLLGLGVTALGGLPLAIIALPAAAALAAGAALAAETPRAAPRLPAAVYTLAAALFLVPIVRAQLAYDRADFETASRLDPTFPLYEARRAWLDLERGAADAARMSAQAAPGLAPLWLGAGLLAQAEGEPWSREALGEACQLDPLGALAPFFLAVGEPEHPLAPRWAARALAADPRLLAARDWVGREGLREQAIREVLALEGLEPWWLEAFETSARIEVDSEGPVRPLALAMDAETGTALSLFAFRRRPWPVYVAQVELDAAALEAIVAPSAAALATTDPGLFSRQGCFPEAPAQTLGGSRLNAS